MSLWDNIKKFTQPYSDDEYEEEEYEEDAKGGFEEEEQEAAPRGRRTSPFASDAKATETSTYRNSTTTTTSGFSGQVVGSASGKQEVVLFHAKAFNDAAKAADELRNRKAVILNMENMDKSLTRRVVDFLSGSVYALDGKVKKIAQSTYFFCPHNMDVTGTLENIPNEAESYF